MLGRCTPGQWHDEGHADLAKPVIGHADDGNLLDRGVLRQRTLDLRRVGVEAADDHHVLQAIQEPEVAALVERADVARVQPAVRSTTSAVAEGSPR